MYQDLGCYASPEEAALSVARWLSLISPRDEEELVGRLIEVYWVLEDSWFDARVIRRETDGTYHVYYPMDGVEEEIDLRQHTWRRKKLVKTVPAAKL